MCEYVDDFPVSCCCARNNPLEFTQSADLTGEHIASARVDNWVSS